jgi:CPA1 family monovalent cation:H+ antiporter
VWVLAERLHLSGIITVVVFAMAASRKVPEIVPARIRVPSWAVWEVAVFVLNVLAFILVGFQLRSILAGATRATNAHYAAVASAVTLAVILARIAWVTGAATFNRWRFRPRAGAPVRCDPMALDRRSAAVVAWCGMRGTVTLAAALALPTGGGSVPPFPHRDLIIVTAFGVVLGTLVVQGLTLRPLMMRLGLRDDGSVEREVRFARVEGLRAALSAAGDDPGHEALALVRHSYELQLRRAEEDLEQDGDTPPVPRVASAAGAPADADLLRAVTGAQRRRVVALRGDGTIGDAAFQRVEEEMDWTELGWAQVLPPDGKDRA